MLFRVISSFDYLWVQFWFFLLLIVQNFIKSHIIIINQINIFELKVNGYILYNTLHNFLLYNTTLEAKQHGGLIGRGFQLALGGAGFRLKC